MRFDGRELNPYTISVSASTLEKGCVYFSVIYSDPDMLVPTIYTLVFIGRGLLDGDSAELFFQDSISYFHGLSIDTADADSPVTIHRCSEDELRGIYEFDEMLNEVLRCSLRRSLKPVE